MSRHSKYDLPTRHNISGMNDKYPKETSSDTIYDLPPTEEIIDIHDKYPNGTTSEIYDLPPTEDLINIHEKSPKESGCDTYNDVSTKMRSCKIYDDVSQNDRSGELYDDFTPRKACFEKSELPTTEDITDTLKISPKASICTPLEVTPRKNTPETHGTSAMDASCDVYDTVLIDKSGAYLEVLPALIPAVKESIYEDVETISRTDQQQQMAVDELLNTEYSYVQEIQLLASDIRNQLNQIPAIAVEELLSNTDEILRVSWAFQKELEKTDLQKQDQLSVIGTLFQELSQDMESVYKVYCADYEKVLLLLNGYKKNTDLYKEIQDRVHAVSSQPVPDLSFFLVKPVQRITKYPLLLRKILESVPPYHVAYNSLNRASAAMEEVNHNINEYKRNKEVATKYTKKEQLSLKDRVSRINTHTLTKKTARLSQMLKHEAGIVQRVEDKEFDNLEERFQRLASRVVELKENTASYLRSFEAFLSAKPHTCELEIPEGSVQLYRCLAEHFYQHIFPEFRWRLQHVVYQPLCRLTETLRGPQHLIKKHTVKLLDYEQLEEKKFETGSVTYEEEDVMNTYRALHSLLMSELPTFNQVALQWLRQIISSFVVLQRDLAKQVLQASEAVMTKLPHINAPQHLFWKSIEDTFRFSGLQMNEFCKKFEVDMPVPSVEQSLSPKSEKQLLSLVKKHGPDKIYQVTGNISGSKDLDLTLQRGHIVALVQEADSRGNKQRWLVDSGGSRGYVPCAKLQPYHLPQSQKPAKQTLLLPESINEKRRHSYTMQETPRPQVYSAVPVFQTVAGYAFAARSSQEVSLQAGQPVTVLEPHDKKGSTEWSLVEVNGQRGYVPSSFLVTVPVQDQHAWAVPDVHYSSQHT